MGLECREPTDARAVAEVIAGRLWRGCRSFWESPGQPLDAVMGRPHLQRTFMSTDFHSIDASALKSRLDEMRRYL